MAKHDEVNNNNRLPSRGEECTTTTTSSSRRPIDFSKITQQSWLKPEFTRLGSSTHFLFITFHKSNQSLRLIFFSFDFMIFYFILFLPFLLEKAFIFNEEVFKISDDALTLNINEMTNYLCLFPLQCIQQLVFIEQKLSIISIVHRRCIARHSMLKKLVVTEQCSTVSKEWG